MLITIQGWEDGQPVKGDITGVNRAQTQAAELLTVQLSQGKTITVKQNPTALRPPGSAAAGEGVRVGCCVWDGAFVLAAWLDAQPAGMFAGKRCVELGAGIGLVGLCLARLGASVVLTDTPSMVVQARLNAAKNKLAAETPAHLKAAGEGSITVQPLDWEAPDAAAAVAALAAQPVDYVIATDCLYRDPNGKGPQPDGTQLMAAAAGLCTSSSTRVLMTTEVRPEGLQQGLLDAFLSAAHAHFSRVERIPVEALPPAFQAAQHVHVYEMGL
jgi:predicted nicotinamide N-methyase